MTEEYGDLYNQGCDLADELITKMEAELQSRLAELPEDERDLVKKGFWHTLYEIF